PHAGDRRLRYVARATMQLDALIDDVAFAVGEPVLRHGGGNLVQLAVDETLDAVVKEDPADPRFSRAFGQLEPRILKIDQRFPEHGALLRILACDSDGPLRGG